MLGQIAKVNSFRLKTFGLETVEMSHINPVDSMHSQSKYGASVVS